MSNTFEIVKSSMVHVLKNISILKNQRNAILEIAALEDGVNKNQIIRQKLMIICFSPLSSWVLFLALLAFYLNPFRYVMSLSQVSFLNGFVTDVLFSTDYRIILVTGFLLFVFSFVFQIELILLALLGFLISNGDLHLRNALLFLPLVILGRLVLHFILVHPLKHIRAPFHIFTSKKSQLLSAEAKKMWLIICILIFTSWIMTTWLTLNSFQFLSDHGMFSNNMHFLRFEVYVVSVFTYYFMEFFILSIWGHFHCLKLRP